MVSPGVQLADFKPNGIVSYEIDRRTSLFQVHAFASGLVSAVAHSPKFEIKDWDGEVRLNPDCLTKGTIQAVVKPDGLKLIDQVSERDHRLILKIMHSEVLETKEHGEILFLGEWAMTKELSKSSYEIHVSGSLTLHGVTNPLSFDAKVDLGVDTFRAVGKFIIFQTDFGIKTVSIAASTLTLRDELAFSFFVVGRKSIKKI